MHEINSSNPAVHTVTICSDALVTRYGVQKTDTGIIDSARRHGQSASTEYLMSHRLSVLSWRFVASADDVASDKQNRRNIRRCMGRPRACMLIAGVAQHE